MAKDIATLDSDIPNWEILNAIRANASTQYQDRIPDATKASVQAVIKSLMDPRNRRWKNEFVDALVNRIGLTIVRSNSWTNPLAEFKRGMLEWGSTIEEIQTGLVEAHVYNPDRDEMERTLFGRELPEVQTNFHTVNRENFYKVTVNNNMLNRAFVESNGLASFINQLMESPTTSDNLDEFLLTTSLFSQYENNGGFWHVNIPQIDTFGADEADAKMALRKMRAMAGNLKFLSTKYNAAGMPVYADPEDLLLLITPEANAGIDVEALAGAFNISKAEMIGRVVEIPKDNFAIAGTQAIMTTKDFFVIADKIFETQSQYNPASLHYNYFLHHHQVVSCSRFVPAVMFWTGQDDEVIEISKPVTSVTEITFDQLDDGTTPTDVAVGEMVQLLANAVTTPAGGEGGVVWSVSGGTSSGTFITQYGVLHVGLDETATEVTVKVASTWINPDDPRQAPITGTLTVPIVGPPITAWPRIGEIASITVQGVAVTPAVAPGTDAYTVTVPGSEVVAGDVQVGTTGPASVGVTVGALAGGHVPVSIVVDGGDPADPRTYTVDVTVS